MAAAAVMYGSDSAPAKKTVMTAMAPERRSESYNRAIRERAEPARSASGAGGDGARRTTQRGTHPDRPLWRA
jgi:hypothetical protein